jgi:hypothetical protein
MTRFASLPDLDPSACKVESGLAESRSGVYRVTATTSDAWIEIEPLRGGDSIGGMSDRGLRGVEAGEIVGAQVVHATTAPTLWGGVMTLASDDERRWRARLDSLPADPLQATPALLRPHPDDAVGPLCDQQGLYDVTWRIESEDAVLDELEAAPLLKCAGEALPSGWAYSWLEDAEDARSDLGGWDEGPGAETARLVVAGQEMTLVSQDPETLRVVLVHVEGDPYSRAQGRTRRLTSHRLGVVSVD